MFPNLVISDDNLEACSPMSVAKRMLRNLISIGASHANNMREPRYTLLRNCLELMLILNSTETVQYAFMLSRVYLELNINQEKVMHMLQEYRDFPGIGDQVAYLMETCQVGTV